MYAFKYNFLHMTIAKFSRKYKAPFVSFNFAKIVDTMTFDFNYLYPAALTPRMRMCEFISNSFQSKWLPRKGYAVQAPAFRGLKTALKMEVNQEQVKYVLIQSLYLI